MPSLPTRPLRFVDLTPRSAKRPGIFLWKALLMNAGFRRLTD